jgi:2,4-diketo-3-deoxy-L-fuconate hydrolase
MKLISFGEAGRERPGVLLDNDLILDVYSASSGEIPTIRCLLEHGQRGLGRIRELIESGSHEKWTIPAQGIRLGPPVTNPSKIVCVGLNYHSHAQEQNAGLPKSPLLFSKASTSLAGNGDPIWYPVEEENLDYEAEMAFVIGRKAFRVSPKEWESYVAGYTIVNDVSARDAQFGDRKWFRGKSFDSCCPMGPVLMTCDEIFDPHDLKVTAHLNGEIRQEGHTSDLIFSIGELLSFASRNITFVPGDVFSTGTPSGVGIFFKPPKCMNVGDEIKITLEKVGVLSNYVSERREDSPSPYPYSAIRHDEE